MDIVIPVRESRSSNEQLRYALRSFSKNLPHDRVWIVGGKPPWLQNVRHIPTRQGGTKYANTTAAIRAACQHPGVSDQFLYCNDDFFVMQPTPHVPPYHRGAILDLERYYQQINSGWYLRGMRQTRVLLARLGHPDPLSYELHVPMVIDKTVMSAVLDIAAAERIQAVHKRSLYGNLARVGGTRLRDPKVLTRGPGFSRTAPFLSTMSGTFRHGLVGAHIRSRFTTRSPYESTRGA